MIGGSWPPICSDAQGVRARDARLKITLGFDDTERPAVAALYWEAFGGKLGRLMGPERKALPYIADALSPDHAFCARNAADDILGVAGFKSPDGALVNGQLAGMVPHYGIPGALWRMAALAALSSDVDNTRFLIDGLFVAAPFRGQGIGSRLLQSIVQEAADRGYDEVRLDVIDTNSRARALYEQRGFEAVGRNRIGPLSALFGFSSATVMVRRLNRL
ncbi:GNAT family N-acetyltransferase [Ponticoccus sp. SC2-23]|nr:GNAT family N-acetyltransferase [Ponticoccus sp. SC6-9]MBM1225053.1 GNAT family N-acetyltransferase [Ponticoccus sp. SC6-15]MBM1228567.1 GNAT family N-acetyltransferase [Ponticoccus sp. SC6-38]MBM1233796.1 GNAT family N-acetyltransferase [Ponticoccus sp. SC6-45]MBM1239068.1 GNAT family N-acetyltransferase [Ponticoccus sp. SC6-49]MBM1242850.1 GNAT family N-acetyltransferase [Ponticoccus sp. SC2-64]MBM1247320.1 GNAT family N-acetyltransferase [Ponticoccus sp. SC6-42]MBM1252021.1 GNAT family